MSYKKVAKNPILCFDCFQTKNNISRKVFCHDHLYTVYVMCKSVKIYIFYLTNVYAH